MSLPAPGENAVSFGVLDGRYLKTSELRRRRTPGTARIRADTVRADTVLADTMRSGSLLSAPARSFAPRSEDRLENGQPYSKIPSFTVASAPPWRRTCSHAANHGQEIHPSHARHQVLHLRRLTTRLPSGSWQRADRPGNLCLPAIILGLAAAGRPAIRLRNRRPFRIDRAG